jgi:hypothetical protein
VSVRRHYKRIHWVEPSTLAILLSKEYRKTSPNGAAFSARIFFGEFPRLISVKRGSVWVAALDLHQALMKDAPHPP